MRALCFLPAAILKAVRPSASRYPRKKTKDMYSIVKNSNIFKWKEKLYDDIWELFKKESRYSNQNMYD